VNSALAAIPFLRVVRWPEVWRRAGIHPPLPPPVDDLRARANLLEEDIISRFDPSGILPGRRDPGVGSEVRP
jgi:hypothetical protein